MAQRIIHCAASHEKLLAGAAHEALGQFAGGTVAALEDEAALSLLSFAPAVSLLFFSRESFDHALRKLTPENRNGAVAKRLEQWSGNAVNEGIDWLYREERRSLTLTAAGPGGVAGAPIPSDHFEHTMSALDLLVNQGAYGTSTLPEMLINVLRREALLHVETSGARMTSDAPGRNQLSLAIADELRILGRPEFSEHLPFAEPSRGAWVSPPDERIRATLESRRVPIVDWKDGLVSIFGVRALEPLPQQHKTVRILYPDGRRFLQDAADLTGPQLEREFAERSEAGAMPFWHEYLNSLRLEIALLRRAALAKAAGNSRVTRLLAGQIRTEEGLLSGALAEHPTWLNAELPRRSGLGEAERGVLVDARFLARFARAGAHAEAADRYEAFAAFKAKQLAKFQA